MENTEELEIDIDDIGTILKSSRLKQKKSLEEISSELCIRKIYLTALEEGDNETLPPIPYGVGYVRTYARYLGLNPERAVKLYKSASIIEEQKVEPEEVIPEVNKGGNRHLIVGLIAIIMLYGCWSIYNALIRNKTENKEVISIVEDTTADSNISTNEIIENTDDITITTEATAEDITDKQTPIPEETPVVEEEVVIENDKVTIEFSGESWVELKDKKKVYFQGVFHNGDKKEIDYVDNLFISVGRPKNVKVYVKGIEKNIVAKRRKTNIPLDSLE
jgi:cytoskeletal protein RodZ